MRSDAFSTMAKHFGFTIVNDRVVRWYRLNGRRFPWRTDYVDPYKALVTEILLQRTSAKMVATIYPEFFSRFSQIDSLYHVNDHDIMGFFKKIGLPNKIIVIKELARFCVEEYHGAIPNNPKILRLVTGIGEYTIKAFLCNAKNRRVIAVDINVARIFSRVFDVEFHPERRNIPSVISEYANSKKPMCPREFNYGLLDLGAKVCVSRKPKCTFCPLNDNCIAHRKSIQEQ